MLQPINRLKKVRDFNLVMKQGRWVKGLLFDVKIVDLRVLKTEFVPKRVTEDWFRKQLKLAFVVGVKIDKRAVIRNRLKRQIRECVRLLIKDKQIKTGYYVLVVAKKDIKKSLFVEIQKEVESVFRRAGILC